MRFMKFDRPRARFLRAVCAADRGGTSRAMNVICPTGPGGALLRHADLTRLRGRSRFGLAKARGIRVFLKMRQDVDGRDEPGHDDNVGPAARALTLAKAGFTRP